MKKRLIIGVDTSNYTTSVAIVSEDGSIIANLKRPLPVKEGECGLRQSDAVFHHTCSIPSIMEEASKYFEDAEIAAIGVSSRPRNVEGSYMPCFLVGVSVAESIRAATGAPLFEFSHQCGHIMAALFSSGRYDLLESRFGAFHVSGGTTELLNVEFSNDKFKCEIFGETADLNAGQVIDRVGVMLGLRFPAGKELEALALQNIKKIPKKKISVSGSMVNLSGLENMASRLYRETDDKALVAAFTLDYIGSALLSLSNLYEERFGESPIVYAGGVMSNSIIRERISSCGDRSFAEPELSRDNAVGIAELARLKLLSSKSK